jgi:hypothetical protein
VIAADQELSKRDLGPHRKRVELTRLPGPRITPPPRVWGWVSAIGCPSTAGTQATLSGAS